jgi:hypothetical protein
MYDGKFKDMKMPHIYANQDVEIKNRVILILFWYLNIRREKNFWRRKFRAKSINEN